jgi:hypothetical protein
MNKKVTLNLEVEFYTQDNDDFYSQNADLSDAEQLATVKSMLITQIDDAVQIHGLWLEVIAEKIEDLND